MRGHKLNSDEGMPINVADFRIVDRANDLLARVFALDEAIANARAFRALLEDLHSRDLTVIMEPHVTSIGIVRAAILRSAIATAMACLDPEDRRGNRASVGQILSMLQDRTLAEIFPEHECRRESAGAALQCAQKEYAALIASTLFDRGRRLRNESIAHILMPNAPTPTVPYDYVYSLGDASERLTVALYQACDRGTPQFLNHRARLTESAKLFWDTYFSRMQGVS